MTECPKGIPRTLLESSVSKGRRGHHLTNGAKTLRFEKLFLKLKEYK
jgi:hypothetical protein